MNLSNNLEFLVFKEGVGRDKFGEIYGLSRGLIGNYIRGRSVPTIELLIQISKTYNVTLDDLILGDLNSILATSQDFYIKDSMHGGLIAENDIVYISDNKKAPKNFKENLLHSLLFDTEVRELVLNILKEKL